MKKFEFLYRPAVDGEFHNTVQSSDLQTKSTLESVLICHSPEQAFLNFPIFKNQTSQTDTNAEVPILLQILDGLAA